MESDIPEHLVFNCGAEAFSIYDAREAQSLMRSGHGQPWLELRCRPGNVFEGRPLRVVSHSGNKVSVACSDGATVHLDLDNGVAAKELDGTRFRYRGGLEQGNDGLGYIRA